MVTLPSPGEGRGRDKGDNWHQLPGKSHGQGKGRGRGASGGEGLSIFMSCLGGGTVGVGGRRATQDLMVSGWAEASPTASADRPEEAVHCTAAGSGSRKWRGWTDGWEWGPPGYKWHRSPLEGSLDAHMISEHLSLKKAESTSSGVLSGFNTPAALPPRHGGSPFSLSPQEGWTIARA